MDSTASHTSGSVIDGPARESVAKLLVLLPPAPPNRLLDFQPVASAALEAHGQKTRKLKPDLTASVLVVQDTDLPGPPHDRAAGIEAVELIGASVSLVMPTHCTLPHFVADVKDLGRYLEIELAVASKDGRLFHMLVSNRQSTIRIGVAGDSLHMPLVLGSPGGWNHVALDLRKIMRAAFGVEYDACVNVSLHASMRVARCYFSALPLSDGQLPEFLRVHQPPPPGMA